ncbi:type II secretion system ATPase GspE [Marinospirillum sp.]|uniref:type II secretion system ATPase GspE n=1 Tax=Marinospirillum sp. TaxID=2183934 RepID=UPI002870690C|nr:type II secretion system ATPase GspE [Marinospirillum sp.]MDR9468573.1 type II secretion system ATPase GspE [Marinospirillum sp.]
MVELLPYRFAKRFGLLVEPQANGQFVLVAEQGAELKQIQEVIRVRGEPARLEWLSQEDFARHLSRAYDAGRASTSELIEGLEEVSLDSLMEELPAIEDLLESEGEAPIIRLINGLFSEALRLSASDIHIETFEQELLVRFRVDGVLMEVMRPPRKLAPMLVSRIKVMARLDIAEKRHPQDGRITVRAAGREVDIRVSTLPSIYGERVVMRLLDKTAALMGITELGMPQKVAERYQQILQQPNGILLITGPTGSGKTTTLYASLNQLNDSSRNILTVEDPVEYAIAGIGQTSVNVKAGMTFAKGLRAILRQDPDVVMIGEIRDLETASIAVQSSLTGHLVLSTLHTNSALGAITRLRDMGIEPFLLASSLKGVMAQRLVRRLCSHCREPRPVRDSERQWLGETGSELDQVWEAKGCGHCQQTGYLGRVGLYEFVPISPRLSDMIHEGAAEADMAREVFSEWPDLLAAGVERIARGETTLEDVLRVTRS